MKKYKKNLFNFFQQAFRKRRSLVLKRVLPLLILLVLVLYRIQSQNFGENLLKSEQSGGVPTRSALLSNIDDAQADVFQKVILKGKGFGEILENPAPRYPGKLELISAHQTVPMHILSWTDGQIEFVVPQNAQSGKLVLTFEKDSRTLRSNGLKMKVNSFNPKITHLESSKLKPAGLVNVTGEGLGQIYQTKTNVAQGTFVPGRLLVNKEELGIVSWNNDQIKLILPPTLAENHLNLEIIYGDNQTKSQIFPIEIENPQPRITNISLSETIPLSLVTLSGEDFGYYSEQKKGDFPGEVYFNSLKLQISHWGNDNITFYSPDQVFREGKVKVVRRYGNNQVASNEVSLFVKSISPKIERISPKTITPGSIVTIYGQNFGDELKLPDGSSQYPGKVYFSEDSERNINQAAIGKVVSWSNDHIQLYSPLEITKALVFIKLNLTNSPDTSNVLKLKVNSQQPRISSVQPQLIKNGAIITVHGDNFGEELKTPKDGHIAYPGKLFLNGLELVPLVDEWSLNQISFYVPPFAKSGKLYYQTYYGDREIRSNSIELKVRSFPPILEKARLETNQNQKILVIEGSNLGFEIKNPYFPKQLPGKVIVDGNSSLAILEWNNYQIKVDVTPLNQPTKLKVSSFQDREVESNEVTIQ